MTTKPLAGKVALVTGGSRGIGAAIVRRLASDGADVAFSYQSATGKAEQLISDIKTSGGRAYAYKADQADKKQVAHLVTSVFELFGRLDILVNNAGVSLTGVIGDPDADLEALENQMAVNIGGVETAVHTAAPLMPKGSRIITIGSVFGTRAPVAGIGNYAATKAAVGAFTRAWARDLGPKGILVNLIQPGAINTEMNPETGDFAPTLLALAALNRYGQPDEIAGVVSFLAGPDATYITGSRIDVDGGHLT